MTGEKSEGEDPHKRVYRDEGLLDWAKWQLAYMRMKEEGWVLRTRVRITVEVIEDLPRSLTEAP